eukprot:TRINITY_DN45881_c0_g1_i1.p1 TRINITY_DN45881_c0_g1~~TRINITY_DN45881_c0_g1_i1.p1  ORF type:complete len:388 (-),score=55.96 TRINITY_DN45881_c0_g1_i1:28-1191(-)
MKRLTIQLLVIIAGSLRNRTASAGTLGLDSHVATRKTIDSLEPELAIVEPLIQRSASESEWVGDVEQKASRQAKGLMRREIALNRSQDLLSRPIIPSEESVTGAMTSRDSSTNEADDARQDLEDIALRQATNALASGIGKPFTSDTVGRRVQAEPSASVEYPSSKEGRDRRVAPSPPTGSFTSGWRGDSVPARSLVYRAPSPKPVGSILRQNPGVPLLPRVEVTRPPRQPQEGPLWAATKTPHHPLAPPAFTLRSTPMPPGQVAVARALKFGGIRVSSTTTTTLNAVPFEIGKSKMSAKDSVNYPDSLDISRNLIFETAEQAFFALPPIRGVPGNSTGMDGERIESSANTIFFAVLFGMVLATCCGFCCSAASAKSKDKGKKQTNKR